MSTNENSTTDTKTAETGASTLEAEQQRFSQGVLFRGKFFGVEDVKKETGDDICQDSMVKLKAVLAAKKESKQRICIKINLEGIELVDEKTNTPLFKHSVNRISYIARDIKDSRAIGYIYKNSENSFQYFGLRTIDQAQVVFNTLKDLFDVVLKIRNSKKKDAEPAAPASQPVAAPAKPEPITDDDSEKKTENSLLDTNDKSNLLASESVTESQSSNLFDIGNSVTTTTTVQKTEPPKTADPFGLLDLSSSVESNPIAGLNPLASLNINDSIFSLSNNTASPGRAAPAAPVPMNTFGMNPMVTNQMAGNPMMTNPMLSPAGFTPQSYFPNSPNPSSFQQSSMNPAFNNPFGNAFGAGNNQFHAPRPMAPMNTTPVQNSAQNQPNFNDLFSGNQFQNQAANKPQNKPNPSPFQW